MSAPGNLAPGDLARLAWDGRYWRSDASRRAGLPLMRIERWDARRDGALTEAALRQKLESRGYAVSMRAWPAGATAPAEAQLEERIDAVISGVIKITIDEESAILTAGDLVFVPRGAVRRVEVVGSSPAQSFDAVYDPSTELRVVVSSPKDDGPQRK